MVIPAPASTVPRRRAASRYSGWELRLEAQYTHTLRAGSGAVESMCETLYQGTGAHYKEAPCGTAPPLAAVLLESPRAGRLRCELACLADPVIVLDTPVKALEPTLHVPYVFGRPLGDLPEEKHPDPVERV